MRIHRSDNRLLALLILLIAYASFFPGPFIWRPADPFRALLNSWPKRIDAFTLLDAIENLALYIPLGAAAFLYAARRRTTVAAIGWALCLGIALATAIEMVQVYIPSRVSSAFDILCDGAGALIGALLAWRRRPAWEPAVGRINRYRASDASLLIVLWSAYQLFPFIPHLGPRSLPAEVMAWLHPGAVLPAEVFVDLAEWFALALAIEKFRGDMKFRWLASLALLRVILRPFLLTRIFSLDDLLGAALAMAAWTALRPKMRVSAGLALLAISILLRALTAFPFSDLPAAFGEIGVHLRKAFDYSAFIWLLRREGMLYWQAGILLAGALLCVLGTQWLSGAELWIIDPLLAAVAACVLRASAVAGSTKEKLPFKRTC